MMGRLRNQEGNMSLKSTYRIRGTTLSIVTRDGREHIARYTVHTVFLIGILGHWVWAGFFLAHANSA